MDTKNFSKISKKIFPQVIIYLMVASFPFIGAECSTLLNGQSTSITDLLYTWQLQRQTGSNIDICANETVTFHNDNSAYLVCPGTDTVIRTFAVNNNQLTYSLVNQPLATYRIEVVTDSGATKLNMYGTNVDRNLFYVRTTKDLPAEPDVKATENATNSSEK
ncbi:MAG TPA: hypothetical protein VIL99_08510 [Ignavibacteria bacterium]|jgi:citrate lyase synthetase